jgi:anti-sigma B factor antagonist
MSARKSKRQAQRLRLEGGMTIYEAAVLKDRMLDALQAAPRLEVDLSRVTEIDTAGVQLLVLLKREALASGKAFSVVAHSQASQDAIELLNLGGSL